MDLNKIKQKLEDLEAAKGGGGKWKWTPTPGKHQIRMIPYLHDQNDPFIELYFYYKLKKQTILSPVSFGRPDPVQEFVDQLKSTGDKEDWKTAVALQAKPRTYIPILVRGKEEEGVKFWGFGKQIYMELLKVIDDPDYGDISHPKTGRDIVVEVTKTDKPWPDIVIRMKPSSSPMTDKKEILELIKETPKLDSLWKEPSYDELKEMLKKYLENDGEETSSDDKIDASATTDDDDDPFNSNITEDDVPAAPAKAESKSTKPAKKNDPVKPSTQSVDDDFEKLFN